MNFANSDGFLWKNVNTEAFQFYAVYFFFLDKMFLSFLNTLKIIQKVEF